MEKYNNTNTGISKCHITTKREIYVLQQVGYALIALITVTVLLFIIGLLIFKLLKKFSMHLFKGEKLKYLNIVFVGTILLALSQLFGPLVASTYPMICGPGACDYSLSFSYIYILISLIILPRITIPSQQLPIALANIMAIIKRHLYHLAMDS